MRNNFFYLLLIGGALYLSQNQIVNFFKTAKVPPALTTTRECMGKKKCGIIYLAPWCPACNSIIPQLKVMLKNSETNLDFGLKIIVGRGQNAGDNLLKAKEIGEKVIIDDDGTYAKSLNISYFPTMLVLDDKNKIEFKDQEQ